MITTENGDVVQLEGNITVGSEFGQCLQIGKSVTGNVHVARQEISQSERRRSGGVRRRSGAHRRRLLLLLLMVMLLLLADSTLALGLADQRRQLLQIVLLDRRHRGGKGHRRHRAERRHRRHAHGRSVGRHTAHVGQRGRHR